MSAANEVTFPLEPRSGSILIAVGFNPRNAYPNDEAENLPRMDSALGVLLDGFAVKEKLVAHAFRRGIKYDIKE